MRIKGMAARAPALTPGAKRRATPGAVVAGWALAFVAPSPLAIASQASATAVPAAAALKLRLDIPPQPMQKALDEFARQTGLQLIVRDQDVARGLISPPIVGNYSADEALRRMLSGSGLEFSYLNERTIAIRAARSGPSAATKSQPGAEPPGRNAAGFQSVRHQAGDPSSDSQAPGVALQEVVITGSRLPTVSKYGPQEVQTYDSLQIEQSGQDSIADFLTTLPSVSVSSETTTLGFIPTVQLRGLPVGTTLVLLDGRRLEDSGVAYGSYFDLNDIPLAAVERIDVDENGSSAVYGSDAIAGAVNIILKKDFDGFAANAKYDWGKDFGVMRSDAAFGKQWSRGGFSIFASYGIDSGLLKSQRFLTGTNDYTAFGGPDNNYPMCFPGNVFSTTGGPLPGAPAGQGASYAAVTGTTSSGKPAFSQFTYGTLNNCEFLGTAYALIPSKHRVGVFLQGHLEVAPAAELFTEVMYTHLTVDTQEGDQYLFGLPGYQQFTVAASNPYNPFGETVGVTESIPGAPVTEVYDTDFFRPLLGLKGSIDSRWQWEISGWQSVDWTADTTSNLITNDGAIQDALNSSNPATALNPFVAGSVGSPSLLDTLFSNASQKMMSRDRSAEAFIRGPVLSLPAGKMQAVVGGDYVRSALDLNDINNDVNPPNTRLDYHRTYYAAFGETRIPLLAGRGADADTLLTLTISGRHDHYSDFGGDTTKQLGLELRPTDSLLVRGTYADAFAAPSLPSLYAPASTVNAIVTDPTNGAPTSAALVTGGNPGLRPLTGHSHSIGLVYSSRALPGLLLAATQWQVAENNNIQSVAPQVIVDNFPGLVVRNSAGAIVEVIDTEINFGSIEAAGVDYEAEYRRSVGRGTFSIELNATETYRYEQALVPGAAAIEAVGTAEDNGNWAPRWKGTVGLGWTEGILTAYLDGRYTSSYEDYDSTTSIGNFWILDTNWRFRIGRWLGTDRQWLRGSYFEVGATNLLNRGPQFSNFGFDFTGFDASQMSIVGRTLYVHTGVQW